MSKIESSRAGIDFDNMDKSVKAGNDFYKFVNGKWIERTPIPDDKSIYSVFNELDDKNKEDLQTLIREISELENADNGSNEQKIRDFFNTGMNCEKIEADKLKYIETELSDIEKIESIVDIVKCITHWHKKGIRLAFVLYPNPDQQNSEMMILHIYQGGLGLPDRDYYIKEDERSVDIRNEYVKHIQNIFQLIGYKEIETNDIANEIMSLEINLAKASMTRLECRDPQKTFNKFTVNSLTDLSPAIDWKQLFGQLDIDVSHNLNVAQPEFVKSLSHFIETVPVSVWKNYIKWNIIRKLAHYLHEKIEKEHFRFFSQILSGSKEMQARWKRVLNATNFAVGEAIGKKYVEKHFPPKAKKRMTTMIANLKNAMQKRISQVDWMTDETKQKALEKLGTMNFKIGYPDKWMDYSELKVGTESYVLNYLNALQFNTEDEFNQIGKPVDKGDWHMFPQMVNAYYEPQMNEMVFPAGILQAPFFNLNAIDATNYGAIGVVIGHEMTHGFDDQGRKYDKNGNLIDWWTTQDEIKFNQRAKRLIEHFGSFKSVNNICVNGELTLGENIADTGGLSIALEAFKLEYPQYELLPAVNEFSHIQLFFVSYAQIWRAVIRDKELLRRLQEDVHSPAMYRVNGALAHVNEFYEAFGINEHDTLYLNPEKRATIW